MKVHRRFFVPGTRSQMDAFASHLSKALPSYWQAVEANNEQGVGAKYYTFHRDERDGIVAATVCFMSSNHGNEVVKIIPDSGDGLSIDEYNVIQTEFSSIASPVAAALHLTVEETGPEMPITNWITPQAQKRLDAFCLGANKSTGSSHPKDQERWFQFLVQCHRDGKDVPIDIFGSYLVERGWGDEEGHKLVLEFEFSMSLLKHYDQS